MVRPGAPLASFPGMHRLACLALLAASTTACLDPDGDGTYDCVGSDPSDCAGPTPDPISVDQPNKLPVAVGGTARLGATSSSGEILATSATANLALVRLGNLSRRVDVEVTGLAPGAGRVTFSGALASLDATVDVRPLDHLALRLGDARLPDGAPPTFVVGGADTAAQRTVELRLLDASGARLQDQSTKLAGASAPELALSAWDRLVLPATPGTYDAAFEGGALDGQTSSITVVDHVDALTTERIAGDATSGELCFYGVIDDALAVGAGWTIEATGIGQVDHTAANCVSYQDAAAGAELAVTFAGVTQTFEIVPE